MSVNLWNTDSPYTVRLITDTPCEVSPLPDPAPRCYAESNTSCLPSGAALAWLNIPSSSDIIQRACSVASDDLRHHRDTAAGLLVIEAPAAVLQLYGRLCDEAIAPDGAALRPALATSQTELAILRPVLQAREAEVAFLQPTLAAREAEIAGFARELDMTRDLLAAREAEIAGFARELVSMRGQHRTEADGMALH